jgi:hypothetical protein
MFYLTPPRHISTLPFIPSVDGRGSAARSMHGHAWLSLTGVKIRLACSVPGQEPARQAFVEKRRSDLGPQ